ncbi:recombination mediator RecR [Lentisphaerota bacterium WC36G]|nr:recombination mediator RecR [Lentisphaerae bacterium WC36]
MRRELKYPQAVEKLIKKLQLFPGVGRRSAERFANNILQWSIKDQQEFGEIVVNLNKSVSHCRKCGYLTETNQYCDICDDLNRNVNVICVVENCSQLRSIEISGYYQGIYHILDGKISPLDGIKPEDLRIKELFERVTEFYAGNIAEDETLEIVIALSADVEGQATISYLEKKLHEKFPALEVSCLAQGLPAGADISFADGATLNAAFKGRNKL